MDTCNVSLSSDTIVFYVRTTENIGYRTCMEGRQNRRSLRNHALGDGIDCEDSRHRGRSPYAAFRTPIERFGNLGIVSERDF